MAVNDSHIDDIAHAIIGRVHQILTESSDNTNRPTVTGTTSNTPTGQLSNAGLCGNSNQAASRQSLQRTVQVSVYNTST